MSVEVKVPQLPESVTDATLVAWHKTAGDQVSRDENLVDLETDKVVLEVPAPIAGTIAEIRIENGSTVTSGEILAVLEPGEVDKKSEPAPAPAASEPEAEVLAPAPVKTPSSTSSCVKRATSSLWREK